MSEKFKSALIIVNPKAGRHGALESAERLIGEFQKEGVSTCEVLTSGISHARRIAFDEAMKYDLTVACGGDGTLSEVISGLMRLETPPPVGFLPVGSTCDVARTFHLPSDPVKASHHILNGISFAIDIGRVSGTSPILRRDLPEGVVPANEEQLPDYFTYITSFGAFSETSYATRRDLKKKLGHFAYVITGLQSVHSIEPSYVNVMIDGVDRSGSYIFGGVINSFSVGGMIRLDDVVFDDGLFEVMLVKPPKTAGQVARLLSHLLWRRGDSAVIREKAREVILTFDKPVSFTIDGEYGGTRTSWRIRNIPSAIRLRIARPPSN
ncbi:MAG TPA: diacylglycerol kinase family lipid kinase [Bacillota bacterium]|nr:diacylglycerol kinase family lipid kinase [Bacillota bacterium]